MKLGEENSRCPTTVNDLWQGALRNYKDKPCIGVRTEKDRFNFMTFKEMNYHAKCCCCTLSQLAQGRKVEVGIWGAKCPAWMLSVLACARAGIAYAPVSPKLPSYAVNQVVQQSGMFLLFVSEMDLVQVGKTLQRTNHAIEFVVYWGRNLPHYAEEMEEMRKARVTVYHYAEFLEMGELFKNAVRKDVLPDADMAVIYRMDEKGIIYGDRFTHKVIVDEVSAYGKFLNNGQGITGKDVALSSLALDEASHLIAELFLMCKGVRIGYNSYKNGSLISDTQCLQPTLLLSGGTKLEDICHRLNGTDRNKNKQSHLDHAIGSFSTNKDEIKSVTETYEVKKILSRSQDRGLKSFKSFGESQSDTDSISERTTCSDSQGKLGQVDGPKQAMCDYVEGIYKKSAYVRGISVYQHDEDQSLSALVVPNNRQLLRLARLKKIDSSGSENEAILEVVLDDLQQMGKKAGLRQFEMIKTLSFTSLESKDSAPRVHARPAPSFRIPSWLPPWASE